MRDRKEDKSKGSKERKRKERSQGGLDRGRELNICPIQPQKNDREGDIIEKGEGWGVGTHRENEDREKKRRKKKEISIIR